MADPETTTIETPTIFATYAENESGKFTGTITQAALAKQINGALAVARASRFWSPAMRDGAKALADNLASMFELQEHMR